MGLSDAQEGQAGRQAQEELNSGKEFISIKGWPRRQGTWNTCSRKQKKLDRWKLVKSLVEEKSSMLSFVGSAMGNAVGPSSYHEMLLSKPPEDASKKIF